MAKTDIQTLKTEIALHRAMSLDRYAEPASIDMKAALDETTERSKLKQPLVRAWTVHDLKVVIGWFTASSTSHGKSHKPWFWSEAVARVHLRNALARSSAGELAALDAQIGKDIESLFSKETFTCLPPSSSTSVAGSSEPTAPLSTGSTETPSSAASSTGTAASELATSPTPGSPTESKPSASPAADVGSRTRKPAASTASRPVKEKRPAAKPPSPADIKRKADRAEARSKETK